MIRVVIAVDHAGVRDSLRRLLDATQDVVVTGETGNGRDAVEHACAGSCDVLVLDLSVDGLRGVDVLRALRLARPALPMVVLSMDTGAFYRALALRLGATAYVARDRAGRELVEAIRSATTPAAPAA